MLKNIQKKAPAYLPGPGDLGSGTRILPRVASSPPLVGARGPLSRSASNKKPPYGGF